jgi:hypothetical protein
VEKAEREEEDLHQQYAEAEVDGKHWRERLPKYERRGQQLIEQPNSLGGDMTLLPRFLSLSHLDAPLTL